MARVKIDAILEHHRAETRKALEVVLRKHFPDADYNLNMIERDFERAVGRKIGGWIYISPQHIQND